MAFLEINNLNKTFKDGFKVLKDINFSLEKGEVLSIIGSSGSGKTTLLRCLNFLSTPDTGTYTLDGNTIYDASQKYSDEEFRQKRLHFGLVFQNFNLFPQYTALKNVTLALELKQLETQIKAMNRANAYNKKVQRQNKILAKEVKKLFPLPTIQKVVREKLRVLYSKELPQLITIPKPSKKQIQDEANEKALELLAQVGLSDKTGNYPCELSGGQQQRVAIARALALSPDILCFDEPTSALDPELTGEVLKTIKELKSTDRTMIIVTHEMNFARNVSDKVIFMSDGHIVEMGTPEQIFDNPQSDLTRAFLAKSEEEI